MHAVYLACGVRKHPTQLSVLGEQVWWYVLAELVGGLLASAFAWPLYGTGPDYGIWHDIAKQVRMWPCAMHAPV